MSGDEFLVARDSNAAALRIPVVMLSASCLTVLPGSVALVGKPFTSAGLLDVVNRHCGVRAVA